MNKVKGLIIFSKHGLEQMEIRGASKEEVKETIYEGEESPAKKGRVSFIKNFPFEAKWKGQYYSTKQLRVIVKKESGRYVVITVFTFYFGGE